MVNHVWATGSRIDYIFPVLFGVERRVGITGNYSVDDTYAKELSDLESAHKAIAEVETFLSDDWLELETQLIESLTESLDAYIKRYPTSASISSSHSGLQNIVNFYTAQARVHRDRYRGISRRHGMQWRIV